MLVILARFSGFTCIECKQEITRGQVYVIQQTKFGRDRTHESCYKEVNGGKDIQQARNEEE